MGGGGSPGGSWRHPGHGVRATQRARHLQHGPSLHGTAAGQELRDLVRGERQAGQRDAGCGQGDSEPWPAPGLGMTPPVTPRPLHYLRQGQYYKNGDNGAY